MTDRFHRLSLVTGPAAVALWIAGIVVVAGMTDSLPDSAPDQQVLAWVQSNTNQLLAGGWLFILGCLCFIWFCALLRARFLAAEGEPGTLSALVYGGGLVAAAMGMLIPAADIAAAINKNDISPATAATFHHLSDAFFVGAELALVLFMAATAAAAFRTGVLPRWWAIVSVLLAIVLVIGPIGWAGLIFGMPLWTIGTTIILVVRPRDARRSALAPAGA